ncbi:MAG: DsrE family protein [Rhodospirillales bacterium]|nr:DsrE family protein [Rhodospirillales bacterium]
MKFRLLTLLTAAIMAVSAFSISASAEERYGKQKVVYHINYPGGEEDKAYMGAMRNIQNHINAVGAKNLDLKVVIHGNGISLLKSAKDAGALQTSVANLKSQNVSFQVCANTLKGKKLSPDQLYEVFDEDIVPSGVAELAHLQAKGYTYIKP